VIPSEGVNIKPYLLKEFCNFLLFVELSFLIDGIFISCSELLLEWEGFFTS
jgi:hypothetical protein